jgi:IS30 family transposase
MDTVESGKGAKAALLVLTERKTRYELIFKMKSKCQAEVVKVLNALERKLGTKAFRNRFKSFTCDNGCEFLDWQSVERSHFNKQNRTVVYFCHPYCASERGGNENANRLIRRFIPKGCDIGNISKLQILAVQSYINALPRKLLDGYPSNSLFSRLSAL